MGAGGRVAGFAIADDVSARDLQGREPQWTRAKGADTFCPWGPWITTRRRGARPRGPVAAHLGQRRAAPGLADPDLIFGVAELVRFLAERHARARRPDPHRHPVRGRLRDGPAPVPGAGDAVRIEIEHLGAIEHEIVA